MNELNIYKENLNDYINNNNNNNNNNNTTTSNRSSLIYQSNTIGNNFPRKLNDSALMRNNLMNKMDLNHETSV